MGRGDGVIYSFIPGRHLAHRIVERLVYWRDIHCGVVIMSWGNSLEDKIGDGCRCCWKEQVEDDEREL